MTSTIRRVCIFSFLAAALAACDPPRKAEIQAAPLSEPTGYAAPPELTDAVRGADGAVTLAGKAQPETRVRLNSPEGEAIDVTVARDGTWTATLAPSPSPRMYAFAAEAAGRSIRGEGPVLVLPAPGPPALSPRAGFGAVALGRAGRPVIVAFDYDSAGGAAVAGLAPPRASVRLLIDGTQAGSDQADDLGRFAIMAPGVTVAPGRRTLQVATAAAADEVQVMVSAPARPGPAAYLARREEGRWRIDWAVPGGGVQTTLVFDARAGAVP